MSRKNRRYRIMSTQTTVHVTTIFKPKPDWWKWHCSCGRDSSTRFGFPGLAERAGEDHARKFNEETAA